MTVFVPGLEEKDPHKIIQAIQQMAAGRSNATGMVTLTANAASTTVVDQNCSAGSVPHLTPTTADAAAALASTYIPSATIQNGSFVIQHANNAQSDRTFLYSFTG